MIIEANSLITIATVTGVLTVLAAIAMFLYSVLKKENEFQEKEKASLTDYEAVMKKAHEQAQIVLENTAVTAQQLANEAHTTNDDIIGNLDKVLHNIAQKHIQLLNTQATALNTEYEKKLLELHTNLEQTIQAMTQRMQTQFTTELATTEHSLIKKATTAEEVVDEKTKALLAEAQEEIETYKQEQMAKVEEQIMHIVEKTYQDILRRSIPESVQKELIVEALEKAKKEGVFEQ